MRHATRPRRAVRYEREGRGRRTLPAQQLWFAILDAQVETGNPYMLFKDAANRKSNQQHLGTIKSSNLCTEIIEYTAPDETAVCNLASIALPRFVVEGPASALEAADAAAAAEEEAAAAADAEEAVEGEEEEAGAAAAGWAATEFEGGGEGLGVELGAALNA